MKFMGSMAFAAASDKLESAAAQARETATKAAAQASEAATKASEAVRVQASTAAASAVSLDLSKIDATASMQSIADSAKLGAASLGSSASALGSSVSSGLASSVGRQSWAPSTPSASHGGPSTPATAGGAPTAAPAEAEFDSESGGEDGGGSWASGLLGASMASKLGLAAASSAKEKQQLVPKAELSSPGAAEAGAAGWGMPAVPGSLASLGSSMGSSLGLTSPKKEPETALGRLWARHCPALSYRQRLLGFCVCSLLGIILSYGGRSLLRRRGRFCLCCCSVFTSRRRALLAGSRRSGRCLACWSGTRAPSPSSTRWATSSRSPPPLSWWARPNSAATWPRPSGELHPSRATAGTSTEDGGHFY